MQITCNGIPLKSLFRLQFFSQINFSSGTILRNKINLINSLLKTKPRITSNIESSKLTCWRLRIVFILDFFFCCSFPSNNLIFHCSLIIVLIAMAMVCSFSLRCCLHTSCPFLFFLAFAAKKQYQAIILMVLFYEKYCFL